MGITSLYSQLSARPWRSRVLEEAAGEHDRVGKDDDAARGSQRLTGQLPELDPHERFDQETLERTYSDLLESFSNVLKGANFIELPHADVAEWHGEHGRSRVTVKADLDDYRDVRLFRRGHHKETIEISTWFGLRKHTVEAVPPWLYARLGGLST